MLDGRSPFCGVALGAVVFEAEAALDKADGFGVAGVLSMRILASLTRSFCTDASPAALRREEIASSSRRLALAYLGQLIRDLDAELVVDRVEL